MGFEEALKQAKIKILDSQSANGNVGATRRPLAMLTAHPELKAILACNDSMALGHSPQSRRPTQ